MSQVQFQWKPTSGIKIDPAVAHDRFDMIKEKAGGLTPETVVEDARDAASPLHPEFEWDKDKAHGIYLVDRARFLMRNLVEVAIQEGPAQPSRSLISVTRAPKEDEGKRPAKVYVPLSETLSDEYYRKQVVGRAWAELLSWANKYEPYEELGDVRRTILEMAPKTE